MGDYTSLVIGAVFGAGAFAGTVLYMKSRKPQLPPEPPTYISEERQQELFRQRDRNTAALQGR
jgi:hypothetical protein